MRQYPLGRQRREDRDGPASVGDLDGLAGLDAPK